jgi:hypothetical protein
MERDDQGSRDRAGVRRAPLARTTLVATNAAGCGDSLNAQVRRLSTKNSDVEGMRRALAQASRERTPRVARDGDSPGILTTALHLML